MANTLNLGTDGNWATKENSLLGYNSESGNYKPLPFDFTRASSATVVNKAGLIETVQSGIPRIDFKDNTNGALLLEPQKTNLVTYSEDFSSSWTSSGTNPPVLTPSQFISPDGTQNASRLQIPITNTTSILQQLFSHTSGEEYTVSAYVKSNSSSNQEFKLYGDYGVPTGISGVLIATSEWQRFTFTYTATGTGSRSGGFYYVPNTNTDIQIYGFQAEQGSYATSYIPTNGSTVTRVGETCNGAGDASTFNDSEGVLMVEISALANVGGFENLSLSNGSSESRLTIFYRNTLNVIEFRVTVNNVIQMQLQYTIEDAKSFNKMLIKYKENDFAVWINGFELYTDNSGITFGSYPLNNLSFDNGQVSTPSSPFYGNTKQVQYFDSILTDAELETLTSWQSFSEMANGQNYTII